MAKKKKKKSTKRQSKAGSQAPKKAERQAQGSGPKRKKSAEKPARRSETGSGGQGSKTGRSSKTGSGRRRSSRQNGSGDGRSGPLHPVHDIPLHLTARRRYLNYAMSVITSRALPDVRDGLKPVQRRILYAMHHELRLAPGAKPLKCARIVGDVLGKFHPHGDMAVYDALVRMAQDFTLRYPFVDGHGNFGSLDGDGAAAYRYTEARLRELAVELLSELPRETVDWRPSYDGKTTEPIVLPARLPNLLVNGAAGIAVGMATNIPPHNLAEVTQACEELTKNRKLSPDALLDIVKGPDFPTGGQVLSSKAELREIYSAGHGTIRVRGQFSVEEGDRRAPRIVIDSIPYMVQKDVLVRAIGDLVVARKLPQVVDVRDESTDTIRIVLDLKRDAEPDRVMAYLYRRTALQSNFHLNLTCLVPTGEITSETCSPARLGLKDILERFIDFRFRVVERRFEHDLRKLRERIHILEGFKIIFDALDEVIRIIRRSDGRQDAAERLMERFPLDEVQVNAILDLRLYRLARLEIKVVLDELKEKRSEAKRMEEILGSPRKLWSVVRKELRELRERYGDSRKTTIGGRVLQETEFSEEDFIAQEDAYVVLSRDGWLKRATRISDPSKVRVRQGDSLQAVLAGNTREPIVFFTNFGSAYTCRIHDIPATRGYGDPVQKLFKFRDGERVVGVVSLDPRMVPDYGSAEDPAEAIPPQHVLAMTSAGYALRCSLASFAEPSTRTGRRFARLKKGEEVVGTHVVGEGDVVMIATEKGRVLLFDVAEVNFLSGPGRGVLGIKLAQGDRVLGSGVSRGTGEKLTAYTTGNRRVDITTRRYNVTSRGGRGVEVIKRGGLRSVEPPQVRVPELPEVSGNGTGRGDGEH